METIKNFINELAESRGFTNVLNFYQNENANKIIQKYNLELYLLKMQQLKPKTLLLGQAPGYHGCRLTGIPFTCEEVLKRKFFAGDTYIISGNKSEDTATTVWDKLDNLSFYPLLWNIFPLYPHKVNITKDRAPNSGELNWGKDILQELLKHFEHLEKIIAIGRKAEGRLNMLAGKPINFDTSRTVCSFIINGKKVEYKYIRHPSRGGKEKFVTGLETILCDWKCIN